MSSVTSKLFPSGEESPWSPLRLPDFRRVWTGTLVTNVGFWLQSVGGIWLMTRLTSSPLLIALMQVALSLPFFLFGPIAGALADTVDRRKMLLATWAWMAGSAACLMLFALSGYMDPTLLLLLTFSLGVGNAMSAPVWQSIVPELAGRERLAKAVALNGVGFNIARALGPALGGVLVAAVGSAATYALYAVAFVLPIRAVLLWQRAAPAGEPLPAERTLGALRAGVRYLRHAPPLQWVLIRSALFTVFAAALWALLPVIARQRFGDSATIYGVLLGCLGVGSLIGAVLLPLLRKRYAVDRVLQGAAALFALGTAALAFGPSLWIVCPFLVLAGVGWILTMVNVNVSTQTLAPLWVQARALSFYVVASQGGLAAGSFLWGTIASQFGSVIALSFAAFGLFCGVFAVYLWPLPKGAVDLASAGQDLSQQAAESARPSDGPVLVTVEYKIRPGTEEPFRRAIGRMRRVRLRDGAIRWELYRDLETVGRYVELFVVESWAEHLRQHRRLTRADTEIQKEVRTYLASEPRPHVEHLLYERVR